MWMEKVRKTFRKLNKEYKWFNFLVIVITSFIVAGAIFLFPMMIDLWIENESEASTLYGWVSTFTQTDLNVIWLLILIGVAVIALVHIYRNFLIERNEFEQFKKDQARTLLGLYDELNYFDLQKNIKIIMENFSKYHKEVLAIQLYKYEDLAKKNK